MAGRQNEVPAYARRRDEVPGDLYNLWRLARARLGLPMRLPLPGLKGLELLLEEDAWVCVDPRLNDLPVLAWSEFDAKGRDALYRPVACELRYYHLGASMVRARVLVLMQQELSARLRDAGRREI